MGVLNGEKKLICEEQTLAGSIITEAGQKIIARSINFSLERALKVHAWNLNGLYIFGENSYIDGIVTSPYNFSIHAITIYNKIDGNGGNTQFQLDYIDNNGVNQGAICDPVALAQGKGNRFHYVYRIYDDVELSNAGEIAKPVFNKTSFLAGEAILFRLNTAMTLARDFSVIIHYLEEN